ncbi:AlpA family phage regulatory protein [Celeribacter sp. PS-C1]|nr:AlpA family phage regulatory protein [Celeribacter sp. PS-C1]
MFTAEPHSHQFLNVDEVAERYSTSKASIWRWCKTVAHFPKPLKIGPNCTRWRTADLEKYEQHLHDISMTAFPSPYND